MKWILHPFEVLFVVEIHLHNHFQLHHETLLSHWLKVNQLLVGTCNSDIPAALAISRILYLSYLHMLYICKSFEYTFLIHNFESLDRFVLTFNTYAIFILLYCIQCCKTFEHSCSNTKFFPVYTCMSVFSFSLEIERESETALSFSLSIYMTKFFEPHRPMQFSFLYIFIQLLSLQA